MRKYILSTLFFSLATTLTYAHEPYVAPLSYITSNTQIPVISAYAEQALQAEYALKQPTFNIIQPDQSKISITSESTLKSASLIDLPLPQKGTYQISSKVSFPLKYAQHNKEWKTFFDMPADQAKDIKERDYVIPSDFKKAPTLVEVTREWSIQSYVSKEEISSIQSKIDAPIQVEFKQHPNQLIAQQPVQISITKDGKAIKNAELLVRSQGQEEDDATQINVDTNGLATLNFPHAGQYLVEVSEKETKGAKPSNQHYTIISLDVQPTTK